VGNHDVNQVLSFFDPSFTEIDEKGKHIGFADYRKQETDVFSSAQFKNFNRKTTVKDVQLEAGRMVVYYEAQTHFQWQHPKYGWELWINTLSAEATWQRRGDQWKLVISHVLRANTGMDPQWAAMSHAETMNKLKAVQHAADSVLRPCTQSYNGC